MKKLIIEARLNEFARRDDNPHIPYSPQEIVDDALACHEAGAAIAHFHSRHADGTERNDLADFREVVAGVRARSDMLVHPTLGRFDQGSDPLLRLSNVAGLVEEGLAPDIAPLDLGSSNLDRWDPVALRFISDTQVYQNSAADLRGMAARLRGWGVGQQLVLWSVAGARLMRAIIAMGELDRQVYPALLLTGEGMLYGHPASSSGLRAYLDALDGLDAEWTVMINGASYLPMLEEVIAAGGHVAIGLGDHPYAEEGCPANADLVRRVVRVAEAAGRAIASPDEARAMLGLSPHDNRLIEPID